jgi:hypothetical protein
MDMSEQYGESWAMAVARSRGLEIEPAVARHLSNYVGPILAQFAVIAQELSADDDMYEFRRLLAEESRVG